MNGIAVFQVTMLTLQIICVVSQSKGKKPHKPVLIPVGLVYSHFSSHDCFVRVTLLLATPEKKLIVGSLTCLSPSPRTVLDSQ